MPTTRNRALRAATAAAVLLFIAPAVPAHADDTAGFQRLSTFPVHTNAPGEDETVAEISAVSPDGDTVAYTDSPGEGLGLIDITDPSAPKPAGRVELDGEPTSVAFDGERILTVVNTSTDHTDTSGRLVVLDADSRETVDTVELGGQPDSIAVDGKRRLAAVAIENERDEEVNDGDLPQAPAGYLSIVDLETLAVTKVDLTGLAKVAPGDPEPEYVAINSRGQAVVTLQENNHIVIVDLATAKVTGHFPAGTATVDGVDTEDDGRIDASGSITAPREPDSVAWIGDGLIATANEGDWKGGTRGWSVFDTDGRVVADAGNDFEQLAVEHGLYPDNRSDKNGTEPEGLTVGEFDGKPYMFVAAERGNFVAAYDISDPAEPKFRQLMPTSNEPEGLATVPGRDLLIVSSELDEADKQLRSSVQIYGLGDKAGFPSITSAGTDAGHIGWSALSGLSADPSEADRLYAVADSAFTETRLYGIDAGTEPALIDEVTTVTKDGEPAGYDAEGVFARPEGGFWLASEGAPGETANQLVRLDGEARVTEEIPLPDEVAGAATKHGLEGVTAIGEGDEEVVWVAMQRPIEGEESVRLGRYEVTSGDWSWLGYRTDKPEGEAMIGLSEITALGSGALAVIERDDRRGDAAKVKRVYTIDLDGVEPAASGKPPVVKKELATDVLPVLSEGNGWTQDKLEGLAVAGNGRVYAVTDNDFVDDATGETVFADLGGAREVFGDIPGLPGDEQLPTTGAALTWWLAVAVTAVAVGLVLWWSARRRKARADW